MDDYLHSFLVGKRLSGQVLAVVLCFYNCIKRDSRDFVFCSFLASVCTWDWDTVTSTLELNLGSVKWKKAFPLKYMGFSCVFEKYDLLYTNFQHVFKNMSSQEINKCPTHLYERASAAVNLNYLFCLYKICSMTLIIKATHIISHSRSVARSPRYYCPWKCLVVDRALLYTNNYDCS